MWDLETIIKINNEAQAAFEKKNSIEAYKRQEEDRRQAILQEENFISDGVTFVRSMYEGKIDGHSPQGGTRSELS